MHAQFCRRDNGNATLAVCLASFAPSAVAGTLPCPPACPPTALLEFGTTAGAPAKTSAAPTEDSRTGTLEVSRWSGLGVATPVDGALPLPTPSMSIAVLWFVAAVESTHEDATLKFFLFVSRPNTKPGRGSRLKRRARLRAGEGLASSMLFGCRGRCALCSLLDYNRAAFSTLEAFFEFKFLEDRGCTQRVHETLSAPLSTMRGCGRRELVVSLIACVVGPSACFLHSSSCSSRTPTANTRRPTASCPPRATPSADHLEHVEHRPRDLDQDSTPLVDALAEAASNVRSPLFYPGHKMGRYGGIHPHLTFT